jgi:hypothetical protein
MFYISLKANKNRKDKKVRIPGEKTRDKSEEQTREHREQHRIGNNREYRSEEGREDSGENRRAN